MHRGQLAQEARGNRVGVTFGEVLWHALTQAQQVSRMEMERAGYYNQ